jgi:hypothetical protein
MNLARSGVRRWFIAAALCVVIPAGCSSSGRGTSGEGGTGSGGGLGSGGAAGASGGAGGPGGAGGVSGANGGAGASGGAGVNGGASGGAGGPGAAGTSGASGSAGGGAGGPGAAGTSGASGSAGVGGASQPGTFSQVWDFTADAEGWTGAFCDYPPASGMGYDLMFGWASLPAELPAGGGLRMNGNNHSDDLFMYITRPIAGLRPSAAYVMDVVLLIDTNASAECGGIGGSAGLSVTMKVGASATEPSAHEDSLGWLRLNLDKGNQSSGGADLKVVGDISNTLPCVTGTAPYQAKMLTLSHFPVTSSADGKVFAILGTDSGFEGVTTLFYDRISITLTPAN